MSYRWETWSVKLLLFTPKGSAFLNLFTCLDSQNLSTFKNIINIYTILLYLPNTYTVAGAAVKNYILRI